MKRILSLVLATAVLINIGIPAFATDSTDPDAYVSYPKWVHVVNLGCASLGVAAIISGGGVCANPVGGVACIACAAWAVSLGIYELGEHYGG
jgi:hypothetical protein